MKLYNKCAVSSEILLFQPIMCHIDNIMEKLAINIWSNAWTNNEVDGPAESFAVAYSADGFFVKIC
jgi:hypothetical protein